jgi:RIP metalloprotease RseP
MSFTTVLHGCTLLWWYTFVVGVIVIVHEIGHYSVARLFNVRVQVFSFGFGPRLFGVRRGETDFRCSAIPLGGYVSMADGPPEDPNTLAAKRRWQRILIALAGPLINIVLSVCVVAALFMVRFPEAGKTVDPVIGWVDPTGPASRAGVREGDQVVGIDNTAHPSWEELQMHEIAGAGRGGRVSLLRERQQFHMMLTPDFDERQGVGYAGWGLRAEIRIAAVTAGMPAARAGLRAGDVLISINGLRVPSLQSAQRALETAKDGLVQLAYQRDGQQGRTTIGPIREKSLSAVPASWIIGVALEPSQGVRETRNGSSDCRGCSSECTNRNPDRPFLCRNLRATNVPAHHQWALSDRGDFRCRSSRRQFCAARTDRHHQPQFGNHQPAASAYPGRRRHAVAIDRGCARPRYRLHGEGGFRTGRGRSTPRSGSIRYL